MLYKKTITLMASFLIVSNAQAMDTFIQTGSGLVQGIAQNPQFWGGSIAGGFVVSRYYKTFLENPYNKSVKEHTQALKTLQEASEKMQGTLNNLNPQAEQNTKDLKEQAKKIQEVTKSLEAEINKLEALEEKKDELEKKLTEIKDTESKNFESLKDIQENINKTEKQIQKTNELANNLKKQAQENQTKLSEQIEELEEKALETEEKTKKIQKKSEEISNETLILKATTEESMKETQKILIKSVAKKINQDFANQVNQETLEICNIQQKIIVHFLNELKDNKTVSYDDAKQYIQENSNGNQTILKLIEQDKKIDNK